MLGVKKKKGVKKREKREKREQRETREKREKRKKRKKGEGTVALHKLRQPNHPMDVFAGSCRLADCAQKCCDQ